MQTDNIILGYDRQNRPVYYRAFRHDFSVIKTIHRPTPEGQKVLSFARFIYPELSANCI